MVCSSFRRIANDGCRARICGEDSLLECPNHRAFERGGEERMRSSPERYLKSEILHSSLVNSLSTSRAASAVSGVMPSGWSSSILSCLMYCAGRASTSGSARERIVATARLFPARSRRIRFRSAGLMVVKRRSVFSAMISSCVGLSRGHANCMQWTASSDCSSYRSNARMRRRCFLDSASAHEMM